MKCQKCKDRNAVIVFLAFFWEDNPEHDKSIGIARGNPSPRRRQENPTMYGVCETCIGCAVCQYIAKDRSTMINERSVRLSTILEIVHQDTGADLVDVMA